MPIPGLPRARVQLTRARPALATSAMALTEDVLGAEHPLAQELASLRASVARYQVRRSHKY